MCIYIYIMYISVYIIYVTYTYTVNPVTGTEFPYKGKEAEGSPLSHNISKIPLSVECSTTLKFFLSH